MKTLKIIMVLVMMLSFISEKVFVYAEDVTELSIDITYTVRATIHMTSGSLEYEYKIKVGEKLPEPTHEDIPGMEFDGWYNGDDKWDFDDPVEGDMELVGRYRDPSPAVNVEDKSGTPEDDFLDYLDDLGLEPGERTEEYSDTIPEGSIIRNETGEKHEGDTIDYVISKGPEPAPTVNVEDKSGTPEDEFLEYLNEKGLVPGERTEEYSSEFPEGTIIENDTGEKHEGDAIDYIVSKGPLPPEKVNVPDFAGQPEGVLLQYLADKGLKAGSRYEEYDDNIPAGSIIVNETGEKLPGDKVAYIVSKGPDPAGQKVYVEDQSGKPENEFKTYLNENGLKPGTRTEQYSDTVPAGYVIWNEKGQKSKGDTVQYIISKGKRPVDEVTVLDKSGTKEKDFEKYIENLGLKLGTRSEAHSDKYEKGAIIRHDTGVMKIGSKVAYTVSLGKKPSDDGKDDRPATGD